MASLLRMGSDQWQLDDRDEQTLSAAFRDLHPYAVDAGSHDAVLVHERDGEPIGAWSCAGARRLAELLPPSYGELSGALVRLCESVEES